MKPENYWVAGVLGASGIRKIGAQDIGSKNIGTPAHKEQKVKG
jgi:hypothetical protein